MSDKLMSRRKFLAGAGAVIGAASVVGVGFAGRPDEASAATAAAPWTYPTDPAAQPDPEAMGRRAFEVYYTSGCAEATFWPVIEFLATAYPDTWGAMPKNVFRFGGGGVAGWGTLCGTCNGSSGLVGMCVANGTHRTKITDEIMQYYANTPLPTNNADKAVGAGWTPAPFAPRTAAIPPVLPNVPTSTAKSQLCHASLTKWMLTTGATDGSPEQLDRCAKACYDMAKKTTELLNAYFANNANTLPGGVLDPTVATCAAACHSTKGKMACDECHDNSLGDNHWD